MGEQSFIEKVREFIGDMAWRVFLWSARMTDEEYDHAVHFGCGRLDDGWTNLSDKWKYESTTTITTPDEK